MSVRIVGHRGAAAVEAENTLASFHRAVSDGADLLECDVHMSADGHLVVMHDSTIDRTADEDSPRCTGAIADLTRAELDEVRLPGDQHVPALTEVLDVATDASVPIFVEVKAPAAAEKTTQLLVDRGLVSGGEDLSAAPAWIISFHADALRTARRVAPELPLAAVAKQAGTQYWDVVEEIRAQSASLPIKTISEADVAAIRERGMELNVWTVNDAQQLRRATQFEADTITTDDPAWVRDTL